MKTIEAEVIVICLTIVTFFSQVVQSNMTITLDTERDVSRGWNLDGLIYVASGRGLMHIDLPKHFKVVKFKELDGIWLALPDLIEGEESHPTNMRVSYSGSAQLIDSVVIKYCIGGNATMDLRDNAGNLIQDFQSPKPTTYDITKSSYELKKGGFTFTGVTSGPDDFILIDAVYVNYVDVPTTKRPRTTTKRTTPKSTKSPKVGQASSSTLSIFAIPILILAVILR